MELQKGFSGKRSLTIFKILTLVLACTALLSSPEVHTKRTSEALRTVRAPAETVTHFKVETIFTPELVASARNLAHNRSLPNIADRSLERPQNEQRNN